MLFESKVILVGDIGATKTRLALYPGQGEGEQAISENVFQNSNYQSFDAIFGEFFSKFESPIACASLGIAGPITEGKVSLTNLSWSISAAAIGRALSTEHVFLLNDLEALAHAVVKLKESELCCLNPGRAVPGAPIAVVAPGTGLGVAFLTWDGDKYVPHATEGGHLGFAPTNEEEGALLLYLAKRFPRVSAERVCSGIGIPNIYRFLLDTGRENAPKWLTDQLAEATDMTPVIIQAGLDESSPCPICERTLDIFVSVLGAIAGDLALVFLARGGIFLGGGLPPRLLPKLKAPAFIKSFVNKGRYAELVSSIPVSVILDPHAGLRGALYFARSQLSTNPSSL